MLQGEGERERSRVLCSCSRTEDRRWCSGTKRRLNRARLSGVFFYALSRAFHSQSSSLIGRGNKTGAYTLLRHYTRSALCKQRRNQHPRYSELLGKSAKSFVNYPLGHYPVYPLKTKFSQFLKMFRKALELDLKSRVFQHIALIETSK